MDAVEWKEAKFKEIQDEFAKFVTNVGFKNEFVK